MPTLAAEESSPGDAMVTTTPAALAADTGAASVLALAPDLEQNARAALQLRDLGTREQAAAACRALGQRAVGALGLARAYLVTQLAHVMARVESHFPQGALPNKKELFTTALAALVGTEGEAGG